MKTIRRRLLSDQQLGRAPFYSAGTGCVSPNPSPFDVWNVFDMIDLRPPTLSPNSV